MALSIREHITPAFSLSILNKEDMRIAAKSLDTIVLKTEISWIRRIPTKVTIAATICESVMEDAKIPIEIKSAAWKK